MKANLQNIMKHGPKSQEMDGNKKKLQYEKVQKKIFTRWINFYLERVSMKINNLFVDATDYRILSKLLEILSGEKLLHSNDGCDDKENKLNIHKILSFLRTKKRALDIFAADIINGNHQSILKMIWELIYHFEIQSLNFRQEIDNECNGNSPEQCLLSWCQRRTKGYICVNINSFNCKTSWSSGLTLNAIIHANRPDLFHFNQLLSYSDTENLNHALEIAHSELGIPKLLEAEDFNYWLVEEKCVMLYVAFCYRALVQQNNLSSQLELDKMQSKDLRNVNNSTNVIVPEIKLHETSLILLEHFPILEKSVNEKNQFEGEILSEEKLCEKNVCFKKENTDHNSDKNNLYEINNIQFVQRNSNLCQEKTFTKWINSHLEKRGLNVENLFTDLADGHNLLTLLEIISGENLGPPNNSQTKIHKLENLNKCLKFLNAKVRIESIGAEDILYGNPSLILGLIWTIISKFHVNKIQIDTAHKDKQKKTPNKKTANETLFLWCQRRISNYKSVHLINFSSSWRSGLAFNALIHSQNPKLFDFQQLRYNTNIQNLNHAFDIAHTKLGILKLLDAEDIDVEKPDEKSIIIYISSCYHMFEKIPENQGIEKTLIYTEKSIEKKDCNYESKICQESPKNILHQKNFRKKIENTNEHNYSDENFNKLHKNELENNRCLSDSKPEIEKLNSNITKRNPYNDIVQNDGTKKCNSDVPCKQNIDNKHPNLDLNDNYSNKNETEQNDPTYSLQENDMSHICSDKSEEENSIKYIKNAYITINKSSDSVTQNVNNDLQNLLPLLVGIILTVYIGVLLTRIIQSD